MDETLRRIADALERLAPPPPTPPPSDATAYIWDGQSLAVADFAPLPLDLLTGIDDQKARLLENTRRHAQGQAAHDALLWGARGSGKSALVKSVVGAVRDEGHDLALVEIAAHDIGTLPALFAALGDIRSPEPVEGRIASADRASTGSALRRHLIFIDDLAFENDIASARALRSVLEGGARARPPHVRLYVTSNRRHIVARDIEEQASAINVRDVVDDRLALADRFGLSLGFHVCDQDAYLAMIDGYAGFHGLAFDPQDALTFATQRGSRSGRVAWHYVVELAGRAGRRL